MTDPHAALEMIMNIAEGSKTANSLPNIAKIASDALGRTVDPPINNYNLVARAYGLLWLYTGTDKRVHEARKLLLDGMDKDQQERGISQAQLDVLLRQH